LICRNRTTLLCLIFIWCFCTYTVFASENDILSLDLADACNLLLTQNIDLKNNSLDMEMSELNHRMVKKRYNPQFSIATESKYLEPGSTENTESTINHNINTDITKKFIRTGGELSIYSNLTKYDYDNSGSLASLFETEKQYSNAIGININQPLLKNAGPWSDLITVDQSALSLDNSRIDFELTKRQSILDLAYAYFTALKQNKIVNVREQSVATAQQHLDNTRIRFEEGLVAMMDVSQAELQLARQVTSLIQIRQSAESSLDSLKLKLNLPLVTKLELTQEVHNLSESIDMDLLIAEAISNRLEIKSLSNQVRSAEMSVKMAANKRLPNLDLALTAETVHHNNDIDKVFKIEKDDYSVSLGFSWTIGGQTNRESWVQEKIRLKKLNNKLLQKKLAVEKEVMDAIRNHQALVEALKVSEKSVEIADRSLELASQSYQEGLTSNLDIIKAQDDIVDARNGYLSGLIDLAMAKIKLLNVIGREIDPQRLVINYEQ